MTETPTTPEFNNDDEVFLRLQQLLDNYFPEDKLFTEVEEMTVGDALNFAYGQLLDVGEDPDEVFAKFGITEESGGSLDDTPDGLSVTEEEGEI